MPNPGRLARALFLDVKTSGSYLNEREGLMPDDHRALIDQLRAHLTQQRYNAVVIHNQCRSAEHFLEYLARRQIALDTATPDHVASYLNCALRRFRRRHGHPAAPAFREARILREATDENGRYDATKIAHLLDWPVGDIARYLGRDASTISRFASAATPCRTLQSD